MLKIPQVRSRLATSSQSSSSKTLAYPSALDAADERLDDDTNPEADHAVEMDSVIVQTKTDAVTEGAALPNTNEEHGMEQASVFLENHPPLGESHDITEVSVPQLPASPAVTLACDRDSVAAANQPADDQPDTSEAETWAGKHADRASNADVLDVSPGDGSLSLSDEPCRKGPIMANEPERSNGASFGSASISAPMLQNEVGSLVMLHTWRYVPPPRPPVSKPASSSEPIGQAMRLETELAGTHHLEDVSKRQLVAELVDQLIARSHRVENQLGAVLRSGRAMRVSLEVLQRQNVCLQQQLI